MSMAFYGEFQFSFINAFAFLEFRESHFSCDWFSWKQKCGTHPKQSKYFKINRKHTQITYSSTSYDVAHTTVKNRGPWQSMVLGLDKAMVD